MPDPEQACRITVFVPESDLENFIAKIQDDVPSFLGPYDRVMWWSEPKIEHGTEQFRPLDRANPAEGHICETRQIKTVRLEFLCPHDILVIDSLIKDVLKPAHIFNDPVIYYEPVKIS